MNREELKRLWFNMDYSNVKERKQIIVETNYGHVEIMSEILPTTSLQVILR